MKSDRDKCLWRLRRPSSLIAAWLKSAKDDRIAVRRWKRWVEYRQLADRGWIVTVKSLVAAPISTVFEVRSLTLMHGPHVFKRCGVPVYRQVIRMLRYRFQYGLRPKFYYSFHLYATDRANKAADFLHDAGKLLQVVAAHDPIFYESNMYTRKSQFEEWASRNNIPHIRSLIVAKEDFFPAEAMEDVRSSFFVKPDSARGGRGGAAYRFASIGGQDCWKDARDSSYSRGQLHRHLHKKFDEELGGLIVQPLVSNCQHVSDFAGSALSTVRVMTARRCGQKAEVFAAALRLADSPCESTDNFDMGGIAAPIDIATGIIGRGVKKGSSDLVECRAGRRPFYGLQVPWWPEILRLCLRAHESSTGRVPVVGWDICLPDGGPVFVEANHLPGGNLAQAPSGKPLAQTAFAPAVVEELERIYFPEHTERPRGRSSRRNRIREFDRRH